MQSSRVLIVAPDDDLRRSLTFALAAYGYAVTAEPAWPERDALGDFDCVVVHERAMPECGENAMAALVPPVLLLAYSDRAQAEGRIARTLAMPLHGDAVIEAVAAAISEAERR